MWDPPDVEQLPLTSPSDRIIGFTVPTAGIFFVCDHDEVWMVNIPENANLTETDYAPYDFVEQRSDFVGWGLNDKEVREVGTTKIEYTFDPTQDFVVVHYRAGDEAGEIKFRTLSGDWFAASLSDDGRFLVLAEPYDLAVYAVA